MPTATTTPAPAGMSDVIAAMRDIQTEGDRWNLAEALLVMLPAGSNGFQKIIDEATAQGVVGNLSANTLRLYRDTAARWAVDKRVPNVSFSAHREAMVLPIPDAVKLLEQVVKVQGAGKVTVASVRKAVAIKQGKQAPASAQPTTGTPTQVHDILADIKSGGTKLIQAIPGTTTTSDLDELHAGLSKVLQHVEKLRSKAAAKATAAKKGTPAPAAAPAKPNGSAPAPTAGTDEVGDLRGL